jgi:hypothetical protein
VQGRSPLSAGDFIAYVIGRRSPNNTPFKILGYMGLAMDGHNAMKIDLPKLRGLVIDIRIGTLNDPEKIGTEIRIWEAVRGWAILHRQLMDLIQELGDKIDRDSYFASEIIGTKILDKWREDPAGLQAEKGKLIADLAEMDRLIEVLRTRKS